MKILQVVGGLDRGGAETWLVQALRKMDRKAYQMDFLVHTTRPGSYDEDVKALGCRLIPCLPQLSAGKPVQYARNFKRILREYGPYDVVHSHIHHSSGFILLLASMMGVPVRIAHSHADTYASDMASSTLHRGYISIMGGLIHMCATAGISCTDYSAKSLFAERWTDDPRWKVLWYGIDLNPFAGTVDRERQRAELGVAKESFLIGHVGRFAEQKNHKFLVDISEQFCGMEPNAQFLLIGDGPLKRDIEDLVRSKGLADRIIFAGVRKDIPALMKGAMDCFLLPSIFEGLPLVLLEAQAAGLRCMVSDSITEQASVVPGLVHRMSLKTAAVEWACELNRLKAQPRPVWDSVPPELTTYSIEASAEGLARIYDASMLL